MEYKDKLKNPKWQKKRLEILNRDNFTCLCCGDKETELHIHHLEYSNEPWNVNNDKLKTICKHCHLIEHELNEKFNYNVYKQINFIKDLTMIYVIYKEESIFKDLIKIYLYSNKLGLMENGSLFNDNFHFLNKIIKQ